MVNISEREASIELKISSEMKYVDIVIKNLEDYFQRRRISKLEKFKIVVRELLINAIEHGNLNIKEKQIVCFIECIAGDIFRITVQDEGDGFQYRDLDMKIPDDPQQIRSRGYSLINEFCEQIEFNEKGNRVSVLFRFVEETDFKVTEKQGYINITPNGDITASVADKFRFLLKDYVEKGYRKYCFNLKNVVDIDSVTLSSFIILHKLISNDNKESELKITHINTDLLNLFKMTHLDQLFTING